MIDIPTMLERGFGIVSVSDLINLTFHDGLLDAHFAALPGYDEPWNIPIKSRTLDGIREELLQLTSIYLAEYRRTEWDIILTDLVR